MSKKIFFFTDTSVPPVRLTEGLTSGSVNPLPTLAAVDPLLAGSNRFPSPPSEQTEQEINAAISARRARLDATLNDLNEQLAEERRAIDAGERNRNDGTADRTREISLINTIATTRAVGADDIRNIEQNGIPNNFTWLRTKSLEIRSRNIEDLRGQVNVIFGPVNRDGDDSNYNSQEENNLYFTRTRLGGSEGFTKQSIITQVIKPQFVNRQAAEDFGNGRVSDNEFLIYQRRLARQMASVRLLTQLFNRTVVLDRAEKVRQRLISNIGELTGDQYVNPYHCVLIPLALQTDWCKDSKTTHDFLNQYGGNVAVSTVDAEYNYPAPAGYYDADPNQYSETVERTLDSFDSLPEVRKRQLPRYVQVTFNRRSFGSLSTKIEEANGFSTIVPRIVEKMENGAARQYTLNSTFQFLNGAGETLTADEKVAVEAVDLEAELDIFLAAMTSQDEPQPLPPNYFGAEPVVKDQLGNDTPPQQDACVSFLDRIKMTALRSEIRSIQEDFTNDLTYENVWRYTHDVDRQLRLKASRERTEADVAAGRRPALALSNLAESVKTADPNKVTLNARKPEVLFYRIDQHEVIDGEVNLEPRVKYYVRGGKTKYTYVDRRVEFGGRYKYVVYAYVIAPALQYQISKVEPSANVRQNQQMELDGQIGVFSSAQDPFSSDVARLNDNDTFVQAYNNAKGKLTTFLNGNSAGAQLIREGEATFTEMNMAVDVYSRSRLMLLKVPVSSIVYETGGRLGVSLPTAAVLDRPPVPPFVDIVPFKNNSRQIMMNFNGQTDKIFPSKDIDVNDQDNSIPYIPIEPGDESLFEQIRQAQLLENFDLPEGHIEFASEGEDLERFEVYRTTFVPDPRAPYSAFAGNKIADVTRIFGQAYTDNIRPNVTYYYTFRAVDKQGNISNPTEIYKVYISEDKGQVVPTIQAFKPVRPKNQKDTKKMRKFLMIQPYVLQTQAAASEERVGQLPEKTLGSRFKVRVTSRDTGRKVDLNLYFKPPTIIRVEDALNDLVRLRYDLLESTPALVEDRIQEIRNRLESVNVSIEDVGAQLEDRLRQIFGEGNYEEFLEQFQGRDAG
jgi:hypothetical protein